MAPDGEHVVDTVWHAPLAHSLPVAHVMVGPHAVPPLLHVWYWFEFTHCAWFGVHANELGESAHTKESPTCAHAVPAPHGMGCQTSESGPS